MVSGSRAVLHQASDGVSFIQVNIMTTSPLSACKPRRVHSHNLW